MSTKKIIRRITNVEQLAGNSVIAAAGTLIGIKQYFGVPMRLPHLESTLICALPIVNILDGSLRLLHSVHTAWAAYHANEINEIGANNKKIIYGKSLLELLSGAIKIYFSYKDTFDILTTGADITFSLTTTAFCLALTSFIDMMRSIWDMYQIMEHSKEGNQDYFIRAQWEMAFNALRIVGWVCLAYGSPLGWVALSVACLRQVYQFCDKTYCDKTYNYPWATIGLFKRQALVETEENAAEVIASKRNAINNELHAPAYSWR